MQHHDMGKYAYVGSFLTSIFVFLVLLRSSNGKQKNHSQYYLSKDCKLDGKVVAGRGIQRSMRVDATSLEIFSHNSGKESYPANFTCVVYVHAASSHRIMVTFNHLFIPDVDSVCENGLWCFDTNTPYSQSMTEAGGQTGLCKNSYPHSPLVTRQHYFTFTFSSKPLKLSDALLADPNAGFHLTVTAVFEPDSTTGTCVLPSVSVKSPKPEADGAHRCVFEKAKAESSVPLLGDVDTPKYSSELVAMCIPSLAVCDGIVNCPDGSDELVDCRKQTSLMTRILSLGVAASIALGVAIVACGMASLFGIACCCYRALVRHPQSPVHVNTSFPTQNLLQSPSSHRRLPYANGSSLSTLHPYPRYKPPSASFRAMSSDHVYSYPASMSGSIPYLSFPARQTSSHAGYQGSHTPTSSRSAKSARSGRSSAYGCAHYQRPPPPSRADSDHREKIVYPVQL